MPKFIAKGVTPLAIGTDVEFELPEGFFDTDYVGWCEIYTYIEAAVGYMVDQSEPPIVEDLDGNTVFEV